ncbi:MAG: hypothetical protein LBT53_07015 [Puniceicoccales bacterium]|jgi:hypothetical protein|nr:hypothetical protein [Puniceicoccales bacterium]
MKVFLSVLKIVFGVFLGAGAVLTWNYLETQEAKKRGFKPGWVSLAPTSADTRADTRSSRKSDSGLPDTLPPTPTTSATAAAGTPRPAGSTTRQKTPPAVAPKTAPADPHRNDDAFRRLLREDWRWPRSIALTTALQVPIQRSDGTVAGTTVFKPGTPVDVVSVYGSGILQVRLGGNVTSVRYFHTDILRRAAPEGTPRPPRPVAPPPRSVTRTNPATPPRGSEGAPPPAPAPSAPPATTLFGVPIRNND